MLFEDLHTNMVVRIINYEEDGNDRPDHWESDMDEAQSVMKALQAAILINDVTEELNNTSAEVSEKLRVGVGINTQYTVIPQ